MVATAVIVEEFFVDNNHSNMKQLISNTLRRKALNCLRKDFLKILFQQQATVNNFVFG